MNQLDIWETFKSEGVVLSEKEVLPFPSLLSELKIADKKVEEKRFTLVKTQHPYFKKTWPEMAGLSQKETDYGFVWKNPEEVWEYEKELRRLLNE